MPEIDPATTLGTLVADRPARAELFERLRLDYCCGGSQTLAEAAAGRGLDPHTVAELIAALDGQQLPAGDRVEAMDWKHAGVDELCAHIVSVHHEGLRRDLPHITELLGTVVRVHSSVHPELRDLERLFAGMRAELEQHMEQEEWVLFPACRELQTQGDAAEAVDQGVLGLLEHEHEETGDALVALREMADDYDPEKALCGTHHRLLDALRRFELDLHQHIHEENNVLFPRVRELAIAADATKGSNGRA